MGRKIPARKHRTVKDPEVQRRQRFSKIKDKINNPPIKGKENEQEIPKSVLRIMQLKEKAKQMGRRFASKSSKKNRYKPQNENPNFARFDLKQAMGNEQEHPGMEVPNRHIPTNLWQEDGETLRSVADRLQKAAQDMQKEIQFEKQFQVKVERNEQGEVTVVKENKVKRSRSIKQKLSEKRRDRNRQKEEKNKMSNNKEFVKRDIFEFGDIVHAPPVKLTLPGRKGTEEAGRKPGRSNLQLKKLIAIGCEKYNSGAEKKIQLDKQRHEMRRQAVVQAFREMKKTAK